MKILFISLWITISHSNEIKSVYLEKTKPFDLYLTPNKATVISFYDEISELKIGSENDLNGVLSKSDLSEVTLFPNISYKTNTNMIVRLRNKDVLVFNIHFSHSKTFGYLEIKGIKNTSILSEKSGEIKI